jgi:hypothetical protein
MSQLCRKFGTAGYASDRAEAVPAEDAEAVIRAALGEDDLVDGLNGQAFGAAQTAMLFALTRDGSDAAVDALLGTAAAQAEDYLQRRANR